MQMVCTFPRETLMPILPAPFWAEAWKKLRPQALAMVIEFGGYLRLWAMVLGAHVVRILIAVAGVDPEMIKFVAWMEKWVFLALFVGFFWRIIVRLFKDIRG